MARKTASDYRKDYQGLQNKTIALEVRIKNRLKELITAHPNAVIGQTTDNISLKAKVLNTAYYLDTMSISSTLQYIEIIEKYLESQHPHQQLKMFEEICKCDGRDMPTYIEDGKRWCPQCGYEVN